MREQAKHLHALILFAVLLSLTGTGATASADDKVSADSVWTAISRTDLGTTRAAGSKAWIRPDRFSAVRLTPAALDAILVTAPVEFTERAKAAPVVLTLPRPDGGFERFAVVESPVMHPDLELRMAEEGWRMKTYRGTGVDTPGAEVRFDWGGPAGFHAMVHSPHGDYFVDPYWQGDVQLYSSYLQSDYTRQGKGEPAQCLVEADAFAPPAEMTAGTSTKALRNTSGLLRTYRMAMAGTGEYTEFHGGTKAQGQAAVTTSVNRINMVYERDLSVRMTLIANNIDLIYTDGGTDPYTDGDCSAMLAQNQANIDTEIGTANYDIGHVSGVGSGGVASLRSPCNFSLKARGCTGTATPVGDPFDIDLLAHEVGHQFGGQHTWTGADGSCSASNFASDAAYEPGSGSTIQAYAGICGADNIQNSSDDYFHRKSLNEMGIFVNGLGSCSSTGGIVNANEPVASAGGDFTIPIGTPFELTGSGSDTDGDTLTYNWEQFDLGARAALATGDDGVQPIFRSWPSTTSPTRVFPRLVDLVAGTLSPGETLPVTDRTMNFRLTVRDNRAGGGREDDDAMTVTSTTTAGPFVVTAPNGGENFAGGSVQTVTWSVAGTAGGAVNTPNVDILLSTDGGLTYPIILLAGTPNDGTQSVTMPSNVSTAGARVKVKGVGNIFFDISDANFSVNGLSQCRSPALTLDDPGTVMDSMTVTGGSDLADLNVTLDIAHTWVGDLSVSLQHVASGTTVTLIDRPGVPLIDALGCSFDDINAELDDEGTAPVETQCNSAGTAIIGRLTPNNPLSAFDGLTANSTWTLAVTDAVGADTGTLNLWCLGGSYTVAGCPTNLVLDNQTLTGAQTLQATATVTLGPNLTINGTNIVVNAPTVRFTNGVTVGGNFRVGNTTTCP